VINCMIILGPGGRIVYSGPAIELTHWLSSVGFTPLPSSNIVDYAMDVLSGFVVRDDLDQPSDVVDLVRELSARWTDKCMASHLKFLNDEKDDIDEFYNRVKKLNTQNKPGKNPGVPADGVNTRASFWLSFWVCFTRQRKVCTVLDLSQ
jgi:hypothetical protein